AEVNRLQRSSRTMRAIGAVYHAGVYTYPLLDGRRPVLANRVMVSDNFFDVLGVRPVVGRVLETDDDATVTHDLVHPPVQPLVLSHKAWLTWFGGDPAVVGRRLTNPYGPPSYQIVGVAPAGLDFPIGVDYWLPMGHDMAASPLIARLLPGATAASARAEFFDLVGRLRSDTSSKLTVAGVRARSFTSEIVGDVRPVLVALTIGAVILVLIACVNVGNLLLLRASARADETAIRRAIGAGDGDILVFFLMESLVIAALGGAAGLGGALWLTRALIALAPAHLPQLDLVALGGAPVASTIGITCAALFFFAVLPGCVMIRQDVGTPLRGGTRIAGPSRSRVQIRRVLVSAQVTLAFILVAGAGLLMRSMSRLEAAELGFNPHQLSFVAVSFPASRYLDSAQHIFPFGEEVLARIRAVHGVRSVSPVIIPPFTGSGVWRWRFVPVGADAPTSQSLAIPAEVGDSALFTALGVTMVRGRAFSASDRDGSAPVVIVSEAAANQLWPGQDPLGKQLRVLQSLPSGDGVRTVVGVVRDLHFREFHTASPTVFFPWRQAWWQGWLAIRTSGPFGAVFPEIRAAVAALGPDFNASQGQSMDDLLAIPFAVPRLGAFVLSVFGFVALLVAAIGLYAVIATAVKQRTHEIGIRLALGATAAGVRRQVVTDAMRVVGTGALAGVVASLIASRFAASLLYQVSPFDPLTLLGALVLLGATSYCAAFLPAFQVARIDPSMVLRRD
ncbi:MAG TPA: FtsX-like permease family protein, partial [Gemmatimonadaceae bacterium]|nr:FtsX-like permease family protein [Gemmatimonadaceae bacterium]